jgi:predicted GNAT superfamily acetyltransferase
MYRRQLELGVLLGAALLAGCSDRNALTAPSARPLAVTAALVDRPYSWSVTCKGDWGITTSWDWTENGTVIASGFLGCIGTQQASGTGVRPAKANGFTAHVGLDSQSWTFDPAGPFQASLTSSLGGRQGGKLCGMFGCFREDGKLTVDS